MRLHINTLMLNLLHMCFLRKCLPSGLPLQFITKRSGQKKIISIKIKCYFSLFSLQDVKNSEKHPSCVTEAQVDVFYGFRFV